MPDTPDIIEQQPTSGGVNEPTSGTYGEAAALDRLEAELPLSSERPRPGSPFGEVATPAPAGASMPSPQPPGIPSVLSAPTNRPHVPVFSPLEQGPINPVASAVDDRQRRLAWVDAVANSPKASRETREWASRVRDLLVESSVD